MEIKYNNKVIDYSSEELKFYSSITNNFIV